MPFDDPACFRFDRIPVRPVHWLWRPYLACGKPALRGVRPAFAAGRLNFVALVQFDLATRRQTTPMRVRPITRGGFVMGNGMGGIPAAWSHK